MFTVIKTEEGQEVTKLIDATFFNQMVKETVDSFNRTMDVLEQTIAAIEKAADEHLQEQGRNPSA